MSEQFDLFTSKNFNPTGAIKEALREALKSSGLSRDQVAERMNELADKYGTPKGEGNSKGVTESTIEKWCARSATHMIPIRLIPIFCEATKSNRVVEVIAQAAGGLLVTGDDITLLKLARLERDAKTLRRKKTLLELQLKK